MLFFVPVRFTSIGSESICVLRVMSMPSTSFLDEIENLFERLLTGFESAIAQPVIILERYSIRMYRFLRHMALKILRLVWLVFTLTFYVLAPFFVASFGDELRQRGIET